MKILDDNDDVILTFVFFLAVGWLIFILPIRALPLGLLLFARRGFGVAVAVGSWRDMAAQYNGCYVIGLGM